MAKLERTNPKLSETAPIKVTFVGPSFGSNFPAKIIIIGINNVVIDMVSETLLLAHPNSSIKGFTYMLQL